MRNTIALVEDHAILRQLLVKAINSLSGFEVTLDTNSGTAFKKLMRSSLLPDIVILDLHMPDGDGFEVLEWMKRVYPRVKVAVLSMDTDERIVIKAFKAGAKAYFFKSMDFELLSSMLRRVLNGELVFPHQKYESLLMQYDHSQQLADFPRLSKMEIDFINCLASEMSYKEIGKSLHVSPRTLEDYKITLCRKMNVKSRIGLVVAGIKAGLICIEQII